MDFAEKIFRLKQNETNIKTELLAGMTIFFTMSYLFILSPKLLAYAGMDLNASITVTGFTVFIGSIIMALVANKPYAVAPFLGETAFIAYTLTENLGFSIKTIFTAILISGVLLLIMTLLNFREFIVKQIPETIKLAFCAGLGLFFIFISLKDIGLVEFSTKNIPIECGNIFSFPVITGLICFIMIITFSYYKISYGIILSIIITTILGILFGDINMPERIIAIPTSITPSFLQLDFEGIFNTNFISIFFIIFLLVNIDTSGSLIGLSYSCNQQKENNKKAMIADSICVIAAPLIGTTTPGAYLDSMTGISAGGRTGLTSITVGILFLIGLFFTPIICIIPPYAYAPALLYVGILMAKSFIKINFEDITEFGSAIFIIASMIFTYNIGIGIITGFIIYPLIKLLCGQKHKTNITLWIMFVFSIVFILIYPKQN